MSSVKSGHSRLLQFTKYFNSHQLRILKLLFIVTIAVPLYMKVAEWTFCDPRNSKCVSVMVQVSCLSVLKVNTQVFPAKEQQCVLNAALHCSFSSCDSNIRWVFTVLSTVDSAKRLCRLPEAR